MRRLILLLVLVKSHLSLYSQDLLVNGSFEEENTCTEYNATCSPEAWISTGRTLENYIKGLERGHTGNHCYAIEAGHFKNPYQRSVVRSRLLCGMRSGNKYRFTLYLKSPHPILDSIGILFSTDDILYEKRKIRDIQPTSYFGLINKFDKKDTNWQKVEFIYTARGTERFVTIANFSRRDITGTTGIRMMNQFLVYLDDLSLVPLDEKENLCIDWQNRKEEIYDQNERHQFMERLIRMQRYNRLPGEKLLSTTTITIVDTLVVPDILFESGKTELQPGRLKWLDSLCVYAGKKHLDSIVVRGHTDQTGTLLKNEKLSMDRALAVADYMHKRIGISSLTFRCYGLADRFPIADNQTTQGKQRNRRVEILLYIRE